MIKTISKLIFMGLLTMFSSSNSQELNSIYNLSFTSIEGDRMERVLSIESEATGRKLEDIRSKYMAGVSLRRFVTAKDVSDMAVFLASDASRNVTGQAISVDGNTERMV